MSFVFPETYCVYLLLSEKGNRLYLGCTANLEKRINEHKAGKVFSTKRYLPIKLIYWETYISKSDAFNRKKSLKQYGSALGKLKVRLKNTFKNKL